MTSEQQPDNLGADPTRQAQNPNNRPNTNPESAAEALLDAFYEEFVAGRHYEVRKVAGR
jgi:hypothetical protein